MWEIVLEAIASLDFICRGMDIWRIENFKPVPLPKESHGKFYSGDSYILLRVIPLLLFEFYFCSIEDRNILYCWRGISVIIRISRIFCPQVSDNCFILKWFSKKLRFWWQTTALKTGGFHYDIHFWLGKDTSQVLWVLDRSLFIIILSFANCYKIQ
jgi:hypothetical protein